MQRDIALIKRTLFGQRRERFKDPRQFTTRARRSPLHELRLKTIGRDRAPARGLPEAGEPFINGQLSANEVLEFWKLDAELVTLSACETAIGKQGGGDGMSGFAQAFLTAGV